MNKFYTTGFNTQKWISKRLFGAFLAVLTCFVLFAPQVSIGQCNHGSAFGAATAASSNGTVLIATNQWAGEYATLSNIICGATYRVTSSATGDWVTIRRGTPGGTVVSHAVQGTNWVAPASSCGETFYAHISTNSGCGTQNTSRTTNIVTVTQCTGSIVSYGYAIASETNPLVVKPLGCAVTSGSVRVGSGAQTTINIAPNTVYSLSWGSLPANIDEVRVVSNGTGGTVTGNNGSWNSGSSTQMTVQARRSSCSWVATSATLTYNYVTPSIAANNPTSATICTGGSVSIAGGALSNGTARYWQGTTNGGTSLATSGTPNSASATSYYRPYNGPIAAAAGTPALVAGEGCWGTQQATTITVVSDPTIPTLNTGSTSPATGGTVCRGATIAVHLNDGAGGTGTITNYYRYSVDNGSNWLPSATGQSWSAGGGTNFNIVTDALTTTVIVQTQRQASGLDCGTAGFTQVATWSTVAPVSITQHPATQSVCEGSPTVVTLNGNATGGTPTLVLDWQYWNGSTWSSVAANVPYAGVSYSGQGSTSLQITGLNGGTGFASYQYRLQASATGSGCGTANSNPATITVNKIPSITGTYGSMCFGGTPVNLTTNLDATSGVTWANTPSCCITGGPSPAAYVFTAPNPAPSASATYNFVARNANNVSCASSPPLSIIVYSNDVADAGPDQAQCNSGNFTLAALTPAFGTGQWTCMSGCGGVSINSPTSPTSTVSGVAANSTAQLRWRVTNGSCQSDAFVNLKHDIPATFTSSAADMCELGTRTLNATLGGGTFYGSCGPCVSGNTFTAPNVSGVSQNISLGYNVNTCPDATQTITVFNTPQPTVDAGPDQNVCGTSADLAATQLTVGSGVWTVQAGSGTFSPANTNYDATAIGLANGNNTLRWTATNGACSGFDEVVIKSNQVPTAIPHAVGTFTATRECLDVASGYTHYFDNGADATANTADDRRILSLKKNGNNIGTVGVGGFDVKVTLDPNYGSNGYKIGLPGATYVQNNVNTWAVMARWWDVVPTTQPGSDVEVQFYFDETDYQDVLNMAASQGWEPIQVPYLDLQFYKMIGNINPSPATGHPGVTPTDVQIYDVNAYHPNVKQWFYSPFGSDHIARFAVNSFSGGGGGFGGGGQGALPVELLYLTATAIDNNYISVDWATVLEINNAGFEVQRSTDAQNWSTISWVAGNNNSTVQHTYQYKDQNVQKGIVYYYRLKQIDNDSHYEYTKIVSAILNGKNTFTVLDFVPNPTLDQTSLLITANAGTEITVEFYSGIGEKMSSGKYVLNVGVNTIPFVVHQLAAGTFTAIVTNGNEVYSKKLIVTR
ncbi:MAG: T9SS type A sorting domain-containing protein [Chitinophagales bacterium]|nr:T9SS type A sorting domain-containing protein [Chitinophagales bacterium]